MIGKQYEYDRMAACEKELWWYKCLHEITCTKIKKYATSSDPAILDAGSGTGGLLSILNKNNYSNTKGFDLSEDAVGHTFSSYGFAVQTLNILDAGKAYPSASFDIVVSNDVICLLPDIQAKEAFKNLVSLLKPGGLLLMNLPAGKAFRGTHDIAVSIQKRYSPKDIRELAEEEMIIRDMTYWPFILSPLIMALRFTQRIKMLFNKNLVITSDVSLPNPFINTIFHSITQTENKILSHKPWGSSLFTVLQKK